MSAISEIYLAIANLQIGGVQARNLPEVTLDVAEGDLPLRILTPSMRAEVSPIMIGTLQKVEWAIRDLCLWAPVGGDERQYFKPMQDYVNAYITALKTIVNPTLQSTLTGVGIEMIPRLWAEAWYFAIDITLSVEEHL